MANIQQNIEKIKDFVNTPKRIRTIEKISILLLMVASFFMGKLSIVDQEKSVHAPQVKVLLPNGTQYSSNRGEIAQNGSNLVANTVKATNSNISTDLSVFGSKNGTTYYFTWCKSGNRIKEENKIWFESESKAQEAGYRKSSLCK